jgi:hypothetical protein
VLKESGCMSGEHKRVSYMHGTYGREVVVEEGIGCRNTAYDEDRVEEGGYERPRRI